jgi:uncharacterized RDD family membrane protein YckC
MSAEIVATRYPKAPLWRRGIALAIDFVVIYVLSALLSHELGGRTLIFFGAWLVLRVFIPSANQGQSFGRWVLDMRVVDVRFGGTPGLAELAKREIVVGFGTVLIMWAFIYLDSATAWIILLPIPLLIDCSLAMGDRLKRQAFHDQIGQTLIAQTRRGYSLDLRLKQLVAQLRYRMK